ncbi:MAG: manganese efflux pump MntP family protein [Candidatus Izemoplasmatales bacterium]
MAWWEVLLIAIGLSMDAFAVAVCKGVGMKAHHALTGLSIGLCFGAFQFLMPVGGYYLGTAFSDVVAGFDHWIAFALLSVIGVKMILESLRPETQACDLSLRLGELLALGVATSIDAFAVGLSFSFVAVDVWLAAGIIGLVTFVLSLSGFLLGRRIGSFVRRRAGVIGGAILIFIGLRILLVHLGILR